MRRPPIDKKRLQWLGRKGLKPPEEKRTRGYKGNGYQQWLNYLADTRHPISCILDIGANIGEFTTELAELFPETRIHSIEASPRTAEVLKNASQHLNASRRASSGIYVHNIAVSDRTEVVSIYARRKNGTDTDTGNSIGKSEQFGILRANIQAYTLEEFIRTQATSCESHIIVKVDIEGFDFKSLHGMKELFKKRSIDAIQLEYNPIAWCQLGNATSPNSYGSCVEREKSWSEDSLLSSIVFFLASFQYLSYLIGPVYFPLVDLSHSPDFVGTGDILAMPRESRWAQAMRCTLTNGTCCIGPA